MLFIIYSRPKETPLVFESTGQANPRTLFVTAEGLRPDKQDEKGRCLKAREVVWKVDLDSEVKTLLREKKARF